MERFPSKRTPESGEEEITPQEVAKSLRENPDDRSLLQAYLDKREAEVKAQNTSRATLDLEVERAEIYRDAGWIVPANKTFHDAALLARCENDDKIYEYCMDEYEKLGGDIRWRWTGEV